MRSVILPIALVAALAACESDGGGGLFGSSSSRDSGVYSGSSTADQRAIARECDPRNVRPEQRATVLHQDRPGGSSCPENVIEDRRGRR